MPKRALALATFSAAIGLAVAVPGFVANSVTGAHVVAAHTPTTADRPVALTAITIGSSAGLRVDGDHHTVLDASQTDAAVNAVNLGSSGGALVNMDGKLNVRPVVCVRGVCNPKE